jgi:two-component system CheB/CheR fusion protein
MSSQENDKEFEALLNYLKASRGFDFGSYKRPSLMRRVSKRVQAIGADNYADYLDYLQVHPDEFMELFNTILINVTSFFRDEAPWQYLKEEIIPKLLAAKKPGEMIRVWSAGCASGEEACTISMVLAEVLGEDRCRRRRAHDGAGILLSAEAG